MDFCPSILPGFSFIKPVLLQKMFTSIIVSSFHHCEFLRAIKEKETGLLCSYSSYRYSGGAVDRWTTAAAAPYESMYDSNKV